MTYTLRFLSEARMEISDAYLFYNNKREGLGDEFVEGLEVIFERIQQNPKQFTQYVEEVRKAVIQRFPFNVFFRIEEHNLITIVAVYHSSRKPGQWEERFDE